MMNSAAIQEWLAAFEEHRGHPTFRTEDWVYRLTMGFVCGCGAEERAWEMDLSTWKALTTSARREFQEVRRQFDVVRQERINLSKEAYEKAEARAAKLLSEHLTPIERESLVAQGFLIVRSPDHRRYRIERGSAMNVVLVSDSGVDICRYCVHPEGFVPISDTILAQKMILESCPEVFFAVANYCWLTADERLRASAIPAGGRTFQLGPQPALVAA